MYKVPIVPPDLRHEETIIKAAQSLDCLQKTINSVFGRIDARISRNDARVQEISERIKCANRKIQKLVGTKKAIKIYAPARFPAAHVLCDIPQTFCDRMSAVKAGINSNQDVEDQKQIVVTSKYDEPTTEAIKEKLIFYHVRTEPNDTELTKERKVVIKETGLGTPTEQFQSVTSILRFNTDEFAYGGLPGTSDDLNAWKIGQRGSQRQIRNNKMEEKQKQGKQLLPPAPHSLVHRNTAKLSTPAGDLRYMPAALEAPAMDTPLDLPDLPGIAKDIQFEPIEQKPIAPSSHYFDLLPTSLTEVIAEHIESATSTSKAEAKIIPVNKINVKEIKLTRAAAPSTVPPPPPPPPPPSLQICPVTPPVISTEQQTEAALRSASGATKHLLSQIPTSSSNNHFYPTSPSNETPLLKEPIQISAATNKKFPPPPSLDVRSELMAAIRNAGGAAGGRLRATSPTELNMDHAAENNDSTLNSVIQNKTMTRNKPNVAGDLMADLHNKLLMRRKGISGSQSIDAQQGAANPVLARLSALIPPPVKQRNSKETDEDDDEGSAAEWID